ncbi:protein kinase C delta type-like [Rhinoderma darwinii]|uniref:protein kinase C delta type-like n=1 Tax=Rhinoderma darwinii TaxID=43563 RepID=UPI003F662130
MKRKWKKEEGGERGKESEGSKEGEGTKKTKMENTGLTAKRSIKNWLLAIMGRRSSRDLPGSSNISLMDEKIRTSGKKESKIKEEEKDRDKKGTEKKETQRKRKRTTEENKPSAKKAKKSKGKTSNSLDELEKKAEEEQPAPSKQEKETPAAPKRKRTADENQESNKKLKTSLRSSKEKTSGSQDATTILNEKPGPSREETRTATVPLSLNSFTFHRELGKGSYGEVTLAKDKIRKELVAIKKTGKSDFTELGHTFVERDILGLSHESRFLIHGLAAFHSKNHVYYVMELASGGDLDTFTENNFPLELNTVKFIAAELVCGVQFLHNKGIIHRDLKPNNVLLTSDGHVKITDFGLAITNVFGRTTDPCGGTLGYVAPEMIGREEYGPGVDWFAFGVILYNMVTNKDPFPGNTKSEIEASVLNYVPQYPMSLSSDTVDIIKRLLCKNQFERLGVTENIREHPFFSTTNWQEVEAGRAAPTDILVTESVDLNISDIRPAPCTRDHNTTIKAKGQKLFNEFSFVCPEWSENYHVSPIYPDTRLRRFSSSQCKVN